MFLTHSQTGGWVLKAARRLTVSIAGRQDVARSGVLCLWGLCREREGVAVDKTQSG